MDSTGQAEYSADITSPAPQETCTNCEAPLYGDYCHQCGQQKGSSIRNVFALVQEFFGEIGNWDSRVIRTLFHLLFRPGFLSREYVAGRRAPYVPPLRLYLFTSIICFILLFAYFGNIGQQINTERSTGVNVSASLSDAESGNHGSGQTSGSPSEMAFEIGFLSPAQQAALNARMQRVNNNPELLLRQIKSQAPQMMFFLLPVFALILKLLYLFSKRYYMEHLILALHTHAFIFVMLMLWIPLDMLDGLAGLPAWLERVISTALTGWFLWILIYLFLCQKRFYGQSLRMTTGKYLLTGLLYNVMLFFAVIGLILASVMTV